MSAGQDHALVWAVLVPLLAARPRVRESRGGRHRFERRWERPLTGRLPAVPAAVPIYSGAGDTRVLVVDLDAARGGVDAVRRDSVAVAELVARAGGQVVVDESPSGGRHVYVPFAEPVGFHDARDLALALALRVPSMDPTPNTNLTDGLIRPPGSRHHSGGHQLLHGNLTHAAHLARGGNPPPVLHALRAMLADELAAVHAQQHGTADLAELEEAGGVPGRRHPRELAADYLRIATTGLYDTGKYRSPSEARQAVLTAAVWAGLTLPALAARIETGSWPGLAAFYARYRPGTRRTALIADWRKARTYVAAQHAKPDQHRTRNHVHRSPTSQPPSHGGPPTPETDQDQQAGSAEPEHGRSARGSQEEYRWLRTWWNALALLENRRYPSRAGITSRWLLRAIGEAAFKTGSRYIAFGTRSLSIATGVDHTTVAAHLRALREETDPFLDLIENNRGLQGDLYQLRIPDQIAHRASTVAWRAGKLHGLRPVFRDLGHNAAFVHEALEHAASKTGPGLRSFDLVQSTGLSRGAVHEALQTLAAWNLVTQQDGRWQHNPNTSLNQLAEQFGCTEHIRAIITRHRDERAAYRRALRIVDHHPITLDPIDEHLWPPPEPPPEDDQTVIELLERMLGAYPIPVGA